MACIFAAAQCPSTSPLGKGLHAIFEWVYYKTTSALTVELPQEMPSSVKEGTVPVPEEAWYTDGSSRGNFCVWTAMAIQPQPDTIWF